jgi:hypothetical protein
LGGILLAKEIRNWWRAVCKPNFHPKPIGGGKAVYENGYVVNKRIFAAGMVLVVLGLLVAFDIEGWDFSKKIYLHCPGPSMCTNPLYLTCSEYYCFYETLHPGFTIGEPPSKTYDWYPLFVFFVMSFVVMVNHFLYNKNFNFKIE